jgi:hypothetical protein
MLTLFFVVVVVVVKSRLGVLTDIHRHWRQGWHLCHKRASCDIFGGGLNVGEVTRNEADTRVPRDDVVVCEGADEGEDIVQGGAAMDDDQPGQV